MDSVSKAGSTKVNRPGLLVIQTSAGQRYGVSSNSSFLEGAGDNEGFLVSELQMSQILNLLMGNDKLKWESMSAESPYLKDHSVLLWFGATDPYSDSLMCSIGTADTAIPILQAITKYLPDSTCKEFQKSIEKMKESNK
jgi:hypothetical protein